MNPTIETYKQVVIQIATPYNTGTGFYLHEAGLIITNEHVIRNNRKVVIEGRAFDKQLVRVLFTDSKNDLAFIEPPRDHNMPAVSLHEAPVVSEGEPVIAVGHPFGLKFSTTRGIVSSLATEKGELQYIQHDAALNPGNSGGPLISPGGEVLGVNTFIVKDGENIGFSLPVSHLREAIHDYKELKGKVGTRCAACGNTVSQDGTLIEYCPHCGAAILLPDQAEEYVPEGVCKTVEDLLTEIGYDVRLARRGPNSWEITQGSAKVRISYYEKTGLIFGDAYLCSLPRKSILAIYQYLLRQNYEMEGLTFSLNENDIVLSLLIYDRYLNLETGRRLFKHLFDRADEFDDILVNQYGAKWNTGTETEL